jgi:hypothetical protein
MHRGLVIRQATRAPARDDRLATVTTADGAVLCTVVPGPAFPALAERLRH